MRLIAFAVTFLCAACAASVPSSDTSDEDLATKAFGYTCASAGARILDNADQIEIAVSSAGLRFTDGYGPNLGARDASYRAPKGTSRARYRGFEYGGDCSLSLVIDDSALRGAPGPRLRVQCEGDGFEQDLYTCGASRAARITFPRPKPPAPPSPPAASARRWTCAATVAAILAKRVSLQVDDAGMRLVSSGLTYEGTRDRGYRSRTGTYAGYEAFEYGGDCAMTAVIDEAAISSSAASATLKVRCKGDEFIQDTYACRPAAR